MRCVYSLSALALLACAGVAQGGVFGLADGNTTVNINTQSVGGNRPGMDSWNVDGVNHMYSQWFWFRTASMAQEERINALPLMGEFSSNTNFDPRPDVLTTLFGFAQGLQIEAKFTVSGGTNGSNRSDIGEQLTIRNFGTTPIAMSFFQYADLDLGSDINDDYVEMTNANAVIQADYTSNLAVVETVATPPASRREVGIFPTTIGLLDDNAVYNLNNTTGPLVGRRDYTWAFQWDFVLAPGDSFNISKDKNLIPGPGALALVGLGGLFAGRRRR